MPRRRKPEIDEARAVFTAERKLKAFRLWMQAEREALAFRDLLKQRLAAARAKAAQRPFDQYQEAQRQAYVRKIMRR